MYKLKKIIIILISLSFNAVADNNETLKYLELFGDVFDKVKKDYVIPTNDQELIESALNGMLTSLDPHSGYMNKKAYEEMNIYTKGEFGGLGIEVTMENGIIKIISPVEGTPADVAKIMAGDYIVAIDDEPVMGMTLSDAVDKMRGIAGTSIKLTIIRENTKEPLEFNIKREKIKFRAARSKIEGNIGYLRINSFSEITEDEAKSELKKIRDVLGDKLSGLVLDLRNNPGGLLNQAIAITDMFLDRGEIVSTRGRNKQDIIRYNATKGDEIKNLPLVILINNGSASASEIVAGALQDHKRAIILGTKSFGKGSVQTVMHVGDYGAIRLTTARYYTPSGRSIQAEGINPDIVVEPAKIEYFQAKDQKKVYSEASLKKHLKNEKKDSLTVTEAKADQIEISSNDYQLTRAFDIIKALNIVTAQ